MRALVLIALIDVTAGEPGPESLPVIQGSRQVALWNFGRGRWDVVDGSWPKTSGAGGVAIVAWNRYVYLAAHQGRSGIKALNLGARRWEVIPSPPVEPRSLCGAAVCGPRFAFWGGFADGHPDRTFDDGAIFDFRARAWTRLPDTGLGKRWGVNMAWIGEDIILWGGYGEAGDGNDGVIVHARTGKVRRMKEAPIKGRMSGIFMPLRDRVFVWGGYTSSGGFFLDGALYDPKTDEWEALPPAPVSAREHIGAAAIGSKIYIFGGYGGGETFKDGVSFDASLNRWGRLPELPFLCDRPVVTALGSRLYVWSGSANVKQLQAAFLDLKAGAWKEIPMPFESCVPEVHYH